MTNNKNNPRQYFEEQKEKYTKSLSDVLLQIKKISIARISVFLITVVGIYLAVAYSLQTIALLFISGIALFIYLVYIHIGLEKKKIWFETLVDINRDELRLLDGQTEGMPTGKEFLSSSHSYNEDLDMFGEKSLFQLINRTTTTTGKTMLANRLNNLIDDIPSLKSRQEAISELSSKPNWRQNFQAAGKIFKESQSDQANLLKWAKSSSNIFNTVFYRAMLIINPILGFGILTLIELNILTISSFLMFLIIPLFLVGTKLGVINKIHNDVSKKSGLLLKYAELLSMIAREEFESGLLCNIKDKITGEKSANIAVKKIAKIMKSMDYRLNMLVGIFLNVFFLWDIKVAIKIDVWKKQYAQYLEIWFDQLSTMDELQSFAAFNFNFQDSIFPDFCDGEFKIVASNVKHPFISKKVSVGNEINFDGWKQYQVITGANMAGKSTYLRTVGVNIVLALTGSSVLANKFCIRPINLFTGIKTTDSLQDGESYFFAELKRLKELIEKLEEGEKLFVILDEVLRGTNSADKQKGSMALITQLINLNSSGMIATHDLTLGSLADEFPINIINKRFEVEIADNELVFDYSLKEGISQNLNATFLMKKMGITV
ncbi:MAG: hypothetical protein HQ521_00295 [Bacteroidetes bacterium]|nr:hypothetical protein [Bacteroidota bacterium]